jgi:nucleoside-diphosphate-sugar epimerase
MQNTKLTEGQGVKKILVGGAGGFIGSHLAKRLKSEGHWVRAVDWKENEYMAEADFCDEFVKLDLRDPDNCKLACAGARRPPRRAPLFRAVLLARDAHRGCARADRRA